MQSSLRVNGPAGQYKPPPPYHFSHNTSRNNNGFENSTSWFLTLNNGAQFGHFSLHKGVTRQNSAQKQRGFLPTCHQDQDDRLNPAVSVNAPYSQTPTQGISYRPQGMIQRGMNQSMAHMSNTTSSSAPQAAYSTRWQSVASVNQATVQNYNYSQTSHQNSCSAVQAFLQNKNKHCFVATNVQSAQEVQVIPESVSQASCLPAAANNQCLHHLASQTNDADAADTVNGCSPLLTYLLTTNDGSNKKFLKTSVPYQVRSNLHQTQKHVQQATVRSNSSLNAPTPAVQLPSQFCLPGTTNSLSHLQNNMAARLVNKLAKDNQANTMSLIYRHINDASNQKVCAPQVNRCEVTDKMETASTLQANKGSVKNSQGHAARAVAVVLPLSQESFPSKQASLPSPNPTSTLHFPSCNQLQNTPVLCPDTIYLKEMQKQQHVISSGNIYTEMNCVKTPPLIQIHMPDAGPKGTVNSQLSLPISRKSTSGKRNTPEEQVVYEEELSSVPTTEWTINKIQKLIQVIEERSGNEPQQSSDGGLEFLEEISYRFWNGDLKALINALRKGWYKNKILQVKEFCREVNQDTVILSQMKSPNNKPTRYCTLQHDDVYKEYCYTSSWLNLNSQLDDIDKEMGFPWFFKYLQECDNGMDAEGSCELEDKSQTELKPSEPEKSATNDDPLKKCTASNIETENHIMLNKDAQPINKTFSTELDTPTLCEENQASEMNYFKIEVLPPDEAKLIFEQIACRSPQTADVTVSEAASSVFDDQQEDLRKGTCHAAAIETVCCIEKWKEQIFGLSSESKCKCKEPNPDEPGPSENKSDHCLLMETSIFDLTEDSDDAPVVVLNDLEHKQESKCSSYSLVLSESEDKNKVSNDKEYFQQDLHKSTDGPQGASADENVIQTLPVQGSCVLISEQISEMQNIYRIETKEDETETPNQTASSTADSSDDEINEDDAKAKDNSDFSLPLSSKKSKLSSRTILERFSKVKNTAPVNTVELELFGSLQEKCASRNTRRSNLKSSGASSRSIQHPPRRLTITMGKKAENLDNNISVKRRIHESWRKSFLLTKMKLKRSRKFDSVSSTSPVKDISPIKVKDILVSSKRKMSSNGSSPCPEKRKAHDHGKSKKSLQEQVLRGSTGEGEPLQGDVLTFNVLPNTFSFREESSNGDTVEHSPADDNAVPVDTEGKRFILKTKGTWSPAQTPASVPDTRNLFQEFRLRFKMNRSTNE